MDALADALASSAGRQVMVSAGAQSRTLMLDSLLQATEAENNRCVVCWTTVLRDWKGDGG